MPDWLLLENLLLSLVVRLGMIVVFSLLVLAGVRRTAGQMERRLEKTVPPGERQERLRTLLQAGVSISHVAIAVLALLMLLNQFEINIAPVLASAGLAGLALSLGSQTFIKDFFGGVLILVENQFTVGDIIKIGDITGTVERITLRATYLRDLEGRRISIPNGDIRTVSNLSTEWARAIVTLNLPREADIERALQELRAAIEDVQGDEKVKPFLLEKPHVEGWVDLTDSSVQVRLSAKTLPGRQWDVASGLRKHALRHLKDAHDASTA